jgi:hypothetical protein
VRFLLAFLLFLSFRDLPVTEDALLDLLRSLDDRIYRLENGGAIAGQISLGPVITIGDGDVEIKVVDTGGTGRNVVFRNTLSGATYTITL